MYLNISRFSFDQKMLEMGTNGAEISENWTIQPIIIYMKKLLDSDWPRVVQFKCNTSAKSITPVQKV